MLAIATQCPTSCTFCSFIDPPITDRINPARPIGHQQRVPIIVPPERNRTKHLPLRDGHFWSLLVVEVALFDHGSVAVVEWVYYSQLAEAVAGKRRTVRTAEGDIEGLMARVG